MPDFADIASHQEEANRRQAINNFKHYLKRQADSLTECVHCNTKIPEARRQAVPGCTLCVSCQELEEKGHGFWG